MPFPQGHALLIGVGTYQYAPRMNVQVTVADAQEVAAVLRDPQFCGYPQQQVSLLQEQSATRDGILSSLDALAARTTENDTVLLFYCGHGDYGEDGAYYLTSYDTQFRGAKVVQGTGVSQQELLAKLQALTARRVLLIFNACHSGEISPVLGAEEAFTGQSLPDQTAAALLATGEGRVIITACRENQVSFIGSGKLTIFTQALVDGLRGTGTSSQHGYISAYDLYTHVYFTVGAEIRRTVSEALRQRYGGTSEPELTVLKGVGPFAVSLYRGATMLGDFSAPERPADETVFREVDPAYSREMLQLQIGGDIVGRDKVGGHQVTGNVGGHVIGSVSGDVVGGDNVAGDKVGGDKIDARGAQGFVNRPTGPVTQTFGPQRTINTGGGDYAEGNIDKRQGAFVSGGTVYGPVVGSNQGTISTSYGGMPAGGGPPPTLQSALAQVQQAAAQAQQRGDGDLAYDLEDVGRDLAAALRAQQEGKTERRATRLRAAQETLRRIVTEHPELNSLTQMLDQVE